MKFAIHKNGIDPVRDRIADTIVTELKNNGLDLTSMENGANFVLNLTNIDEPIPFRRKSQAVFVVSLAAINKPARDMRALCYKTLIRSLSNLMICVVQSNKKSEPNPEIYFTTPEVGFYHYPFDAGKVINNMFPIINSHLMIKNQLIADLPEKFWETSVVVEDLKRFGEELDHLGVLPSPFPLRDVLKQEDIDDLYRLFEVKGISYGNLSAREHIPELGDSTFWMTARGVNKAKLSTIGQDILLVKDYDETTGEVVVTVPPNHHPKARVSVDAIEHKLIYQTFPGVGAIIHVHAWMDNVLCTRQNYPCGTIELANEVVNMLKQTDNPERAVVGLKNHGLTITGPNLPDIFDRIRGKLKTEVPMFE
jgi:ribulose-5-phosphate 4-epimerase/fuculose-1-phosphate aldolase